MASISPQELVLIQGNTTTYSELHRVSDTAFLTFAVILTVNWVFGSSFNLVCVCVFLTNRDLRSQINIFIVALNTCDLIICSFDCPMCALSAWCKTWLWGRRFCIAEGFLYYSLVVTAVYIITCISFYRYVVICRPAWVPECVGRQDYAVCVACYTVGCLWASIPLFGWSSYRLELGGVTCGPAWNKSSRTDMIYMYSAIVFGLGIPFTVLAASYSSIVIKITKAARLIKWDNNSAIARHNLRMEQNVMWTCVLIMLSFLSCWTPSLVVFLIQGIFHKELLPGAVLALPPVIGKMQGLLNPIVYVLTNKQMRKATYKWCQNCKNALLR